jgi:hypothetical protein
MGNGRVTTSRFQPAPNHEAQPSMFQRRPFVPVPSEETEETIDERPQRSLQQPTNTSLVNIPLYAPGQTPAPPIQPQSEENIDLEDEEEPEKETAVQAKLTIGQPGDKYEQEADATAARVMAMPMPGPSTQAETAEEPGTLQRQPELDEEDSETVQQRPIGLQRQALSDGEKPNKDKSLTQLKPLVQAKGKGNSAPQGFEQRLSQHKGGGQPLPDETKAFMEPRFGADFSSVRIHEAPKEASDIGAQAFTHGQDIYFNAGKYNPGSSSGKELLAHELTHVVQQVGSVVQAKLAQNKQETQFQEEEPDDIPAKQAFFLTSQALTNKNSFQTKEPREGTQAQEIAGNQESVGDQTEAKKAISNVDLAEKEQKKTELIQEKQPEVGQKQQVLRQIGQQAQQASQATEQPPEPIAEVKAPQAPQGQTAKPGAAQSVKTDLPQQAPAQSADSPRLSAQPQAVIPPEPVMLVDAGGMSLPGNPEADAQISQLAQQAQNLRDGGNHLLAQAAQIRANAQVIRGNIQLVKQGVDQSEQGVSTSTEHLNFRQETVEQAKQALEVSEQKATTVAEQAPGFVDKSNQGREKTQPMVSQANDLAGQSAANTPEDPEAAGKSREQGQKLNKVATDTATMDEAFSQTKAKAEGLAADAAQAQGMNTQTSAQIGEMETTLGQSQERLTQMSEQNQQARTQAESLEGKPDEMISQAAVLEEKGRALIQASFEIEQRLQQTQVEYQQAMSSVPAAKSAEQSGGSETGVIQRDVEEGRYDERENIDLVGSLSEAAPWLTGVDPATEEQRQAAAEAAEARRQQQIAQINSIAGGSFENLSAGQKIGISLELMGQNIADSLSNIEWPDWRQLALSLIDPRTALTGVVSGLSQILSGGANLFSAEQWSKDPLGNFLKSAADIATGLTIILGSITALAGIIIAIMGAATLLSLGLAAPATGPVIAFCTTVMTVVGGLTFKVGLVAAALHGLVLIKNLVDAATAETAEDLQNQSEQMTEDTKSAGGALLQAGMGKLAQWGGKKLQGRIAEAGGGTAYAAAMPGRVATKVRNARQWFGQRFGRNKPTPASDPGLANRGYRPKPGERSMTREQYHATRRARGPGLAKRGYRPKPGERSMTKEQWKALNRRQRAIRTVSQADQPLEPTNPNKSTLGHGHSDHGYQTTATQQGHRIRTGTTPSGRNAPPVSKASHFRSPEAEAEALGRARRQLNADIKSSNIPEFDPATGEPNRHPVTVTTNHKNGFGYKVVKQKDSAGNVIRDANNLPLTTTDPTPLKNAKVIFEYVPSAGKWEPVTYFPN